MSTSGELKSSPRFARSPGTSPTAMSVSSICSLPSWTTQTPYHPKSSAGLSIRPRLALPYVTSSRRTTGVADEATYRSPAAAHPKPCQQGKWSPRTSLTLRTAAMGRARLRRTVRLVGAVSLGLVAVAPRSSRSRRPRPTCQPATSDSTAGSASASASGSGGSSPKRLRGDRGLDRCGRSAAWSCAGWPSWSRATSATRLGPVGSPAVVTGTAA
jgi:hypothetical protein